MTFMPLPGASFDMPRGPWRWAQAGGSFWLPPPEATSAYVVDAVFHLILAVATFFFLLIVVLTVLFVILFRRREGAEPGSSASHNTPLEIVWTAIPVAIVLAVFYFGFTGYMDLRHAPANAYDIRVTAKKWSWLFTYSNGYASDVLHVPVDRPIRLTMTSEDVIHSFYVPLFRIKQDVVPGRYTSTWFRALKPGEYDLYCAEYCGTEHSAMLSKVKVHEAGTFEAFLENEMQRLATASPREMGELLYRRQGCAACHSTDGSARVGPTVKGVYGQTHQFSNAVPTVVDDNYIRESILEPMKRIRSGYPAVMPTYKGRLKDEEITALIEYIQSLK